MNKIYHHKWFPRIFYKKPDGGQNSGVTGYFLIEWKSFFSIGLLKFNTGSREAFHSHAFNALTLWLTGEVEEQRIGFPSKTFVPSLKPKYTSRDNVHRVITKYPSWCLTFRGPWLDYWYEIKDSKRTMLTHGRKELNG